MSICSNCYNGCAEIVSDKCVKYTGVDVPVLGIRKGDSLSYVEQALVTFLSATLDGSGITLDIAEENYCELVSQYLQQCTTVTALDLFTALVKAACNIQGQIDTVNTTLGTLNANYTVECVTGVTAASDTHDILQAVINKLCEIDTDLTALSLNVSTNYVSIANLNSYIAAYIASTASSTRYSSRMVPYSILPYAGSLSVFDATGAGLSGTEWEDIYLCNGLNSTPDLRGRAIVGAIAGVPGGTLDSEVDPSASSLNPNYALGTPAGTNSTILTTAQIPSHDHILTDPGHTHVLAVDELSNDGQLAGTNYMANRGDPGTESNYILQNAAGTTPNVGQVGDSDSNISMAETGGGEAHSNIQPVRAMYFITYIPS